MTTTTTATAPFTSLLLPCPRCGESNACIDLHLGDGSFTCAGCGADFSREDLDELIRQWQAFLAWLDAAPGQQPRP